MTNYFKLIEVVPDIVSAHTVKDLPKGLWQYYKSFIQGRPDYSSILDRLIDHIALDQAVYERHETGSIAYAIDEGILSEPEFVETLELDVPRSVDPDTIGESTTITDIPDGLWSTFLERTQSNPNYYRVGDHIIELAGLDVAINQKYGDDTGSLEFFIENGIVDENDITSALEMKNEDD